MSKREHVLSAEVVGVTSAVSEKRNRHLIAKGIGAFGIAGAGLFATTAGVGHADTHIWVGGCGDTGSNYPVQRAQEDGRYNYGAKNIQVNYPASMAPICADPANTNTGDSINIGAQQVVDAFNANRGDQVYAEGFSLGAGVIDRANQIIASQNGGVLPRNFHSTSIGDGWNPVGIQNHPLAAVIEPITSGALGIPTGRDLHPVPGQTVVMDAGDAYATMNVDPFNLGEGITKFARIGQDHRIPNLNNEPYDEVVSGGVTYRIYGNDRDSAINQAIREVGADPGAIGSTFFNVIAPQGDPLKRLPADPPAEWSKTPSFPGELACKAGDGTDYYTPGNAPCGALPTTFTLDVPFVSAPAPFAAPAPFVAPAPEAPAPVAAPVRNPFPSFPGELACIAEDGSEYWTPGDASC